MRIVVLDGYTENPGDLSWDGFKQFGELTVYDRSRPEEVMDRIRGAEIILTNKTVLNRETLSKCDAKYVGVLATGYNVVDVKAAKELGITVCNIPAYSTDAVSEMVFALLLEICRGVGHHAQTVRDGKWSYSPDFCYWDCQQIGLAGKTIGIIGYGRIGKRVGEIAKCFGMNVLAWTRTPRDPECVDLDTLLQKSDVITLHCPLFPETQNLICKQNIDKMKDGVIIINTSRGPVVNEADLAEALESGKVGAAGLDVACVEPIRIDNPLIKARNTFITPHIAWATFEARERLMRIAIDNVAAYLNGEPINTVE